MIKIVSSIVLVGLALVVIGCSDKEPAVAGDVDFRCMQENVLAPKWTCVPAAKGYYASVGVAQKSVAGMGHMRRVALADGRSNLVQQIKSQVKDKVETFTRATGVTNAESVDKVSTAVSKQVAKVDLQGSKSIDVWTAPSGTLFMLVTVPESKVNSEVKKVVKTSFKNDDVLWQQFQSKQALDGLDKEFPTD